MIVPDRPLELPVSPGRRRRLSLGRVRLPGQATRREPHRVVRVRLGRGTYAYQATRPCAIGDVVRVHTRVHGWVERAVVGYGRGGYAGPLKTAYPVSS